MREPNLPLGFAQLFQTLSYLGRSAKKNAFRAQHCLSHSAQLTERLQEATLGSQIVLIIGLQNYVCARVPPTGVDEKVYTSSLEDQED